ncbi:F-box/kelch-repeat protein SKIP11-like [Impatiens glandulifera]|uniref:F-box/kelch-repeat protein SKIP11-like n=1 Tax=Impatiens glandulifera TaxID=253017 RepID=UPI001FB0FBE5|nr:F-box/kelch-repeat protein SKIP11-like [Impatiens glandulifera]
MLEDRSCLVSRGYSANCGRKHCWACMSCRHNKIAIQNGKRPLVNDLEDTEDDEDKSSANKLPSLLGDDLSMAAVDQSGSDGHRMHRNGKRPLVFEIEEDEHFTNKLPKLLENDQSDDHQNQAGNDGGNDPDLDSLIDGLDRDTSISSLIRCSRSDYGSIASVNRGFRSLVRNGELYKLRRQNGVVEHWVYISCDLPAWEAFDPNRNRWMQLPAMDSNVSFLYTDKESLCVGTELLVFGTEFMLNVIYKYSLLTNSWSSGMQMNFPRCLFGSASNGEIAIIAGGCSGATILSNAEMYNSDTGIWKPLPCMHKPRKMCSGVFMDEKFYVIGGIGGNGGSDSKLLTCGEEFDLETETWTHIPNMSPVRISRENEMMPATSEAPPLVAVVDNELYAADHAAMEVRKYDKSSREWVTVGRLPERTASMNGWGLAFRACGRRLICIGGPRAATVNGFIEVNSWIPSEGPPGWNLLSRKQSPTFVYNCAVMGC